MHKISPSKYFSQTNKRLPYTTMPIIFYFQAFYLHFYKLAKFLSAQKNNKRRPLQKKTRSTNFWLKTRNRAWASQKIRTAPSGQPSLILLRKHQRKTARLFFARSELDSTFRAAPRKGQAICACGRPPIRGPKHPRKPQSPRVPAQPCILCSCRRKAFQ